MQLDILINYSNNNSSSEAEPGKWAENFSKFLNAMFHQVASGDPKLSLISESDSPTKARLKKANFMICLVSPEFVHSDQCMSVLKEYEKIHHNEENEVPRIFNVTKSFVAPADLPAVFQGLSTYILHINGNIEEVTDSPTWDRGKDQTACIYSNKMNSFHVPGQTVDYFNIKQPQKSKTKGLGLDRTMRIIHILQ